MSARPPEAGPLAIGVALIFATLALLMLGVQPLLLGALLDEHRLTVPQLTQAATVELLVLGAVSGVMAGAVKLRFLRAWAVAATLLLAVADALCMRAGGGAFVLLRAAAGAGGGVLVWIAVGVCTYTRNPAQLSALSLAMQAGAQGLLAAVLPGTLMVSRGASGGFLALAVLTAVFLPAALALPNAVPTPARDDTGKGPVSAGALAGLAGTFFYTAGIFGVWVFMSPIAHQAGVSAAAADYAVAIALAAQLAGALLAAAIAVRVPAAASILGCGATFLALLAAFGAHPGDAAFLAAVLCFGFIWMAGTPLFVPLLIRADPTRRGAMLLSGVQLLGGSVGPQVTGWFATETDTRGVLVSAAVLFGLGMGCVALAAAVAGRATARDAV